MSSFAYPTLSRQDVAQALVNCGVIEITDADLVNPNPQSAQKLLAAILTSLDFLKEDSLEQLDFGALDSLDNPDLHYDAVRVIELFSKSKKVLSAIGSNLSFNLTDLIRPDSARFLKILSALTNFLLYRHNIMTNLEEICDEVDSLEQKQREYQAGIDQLNAEIAEYDKAHEEQLPLVHEAEAKVNQLHQAIAELNNTQASLRNSLLKMKEKAKEMDEKISKAKFEVLQSEQEKSTLQSKIVQSPERLKRALEEKKEMLVEAKSRERLITQRLHEKSAALEVYAKAYKKMSKHFAQMQNLQEQIVSAKSIDKKLKQLKAKQEEDQVMDLSLEAKLVKLQGRGKQLEEDRRRLEKDRDNKAEECLKELNNLKLDSESRRNALEGRRRDIESKMTEVDSITSKINSVIDSGAEVQLALLQKGELVSNELHKYWSSVGAVLKRIPAGN